MDIMSAFPRSHISEKVLAAMRWFAEQNGAAGLPSVKQVKRQRQQILKCAGVDVKLRRGDLEYAYCVHDLKKIVRDVSRQHCIQRRDANH